MYGTIKDSTSSEVIFGANIFILDLFRGTATGENGSYSINNIPTGNYQIRFSYIGYIQKIINVEIEPNTRKEFNIKLQPEIYEGEEITVLAQAAGQVAAIKQQLESNTIVNVVSKERLSELPDQNAAESVARLPGVSVQRDAGEASKVVVRGLSPRFNSITVNGIRLPGSGDDRSVDLSLVPSEILDGIEV
ncbi:MAG: carboxypeptidase-like regulatory domain-containing protein, partial [Balneola sp.]